MTDVCGRTPNDLLKRSKRKNMSADSHLSTLRDTEGPLSSCLAFSGRLRQPPFNKVRNVGKKK